ncbi:hypothetical protein [Chroococcidiopsis sp.]
MTQKVVRYGLENQFARMPKQRSRVESRSHYSISISIRRKESKSVNSGRG